MTQKINGITYDFMSMLNYAEELFGEWNKEWTFIGIEFRENGPYIL